MPLLWASQKASNEWREYFFLFINSWSFPKLADVILNFVFLFIFNFKKIFKADGMSWLKSRPPLWAPLSRSSYCLSLFSSTRQNQSPPFVYFSFLNGRSLFKQKKHIYIIKSITFPMINNNNNNNNKKVLLCVGPCWCSAHGSNLA